MGSDDRRLPSAHTALAISDHARHANRRSVTGMISPLSLISALLLGSMIFFAVLVAPSVHKLLDAENAGRYLSDLFPRFYLWGIALSLAGTLVALYNRSPAFLLIGIVLCGYVYSRQWLVPKIIRARETWLANDSPQNKAKFDKLHKQSVLANTIQIVLLAILIFVG